MMRTQIQFTVEQARDLRAWAAHLGISFSEAVRRCVTERLARDDVRVDRKARVRAALAVCGKYHDPRGNRRTATEHDRVLAEIFRR
jgi:hypothetical protein